MKFIRGDSQPFKFKITKQDGSNVDENYKEVEDE